MFVPTRQRLFFLKVFSFVIAVSAAQPVQTWRAGSQNFARSGDIFGTRNFIENKGQFTPLEYAGAKVLFHYNHAGQKVWLTENGVVYEVVKQPAMDEEYREALEHGDTRSKYQPVVSRVFVRWQGSNPDISVTATQKQTHYFTYGAAALNSYTYKKVVYHNVYDGIDLEFALPDEKDQGVKYSFVVRPGADPSLISMKYEGDLSSLRIQKDGNLLICTPAGDITEHAPKSYYSDGNPVSSSFSIDGNNITFQLPGRLDGNRELVIDPWVTTVSNFGSGGAYDVDYDFSGNTFIYGGSSPWLVSMYNTSGVLQWTFSGSLSSPSWSGNYCSNFGVNKLTSKTYVGQGFQMNGAQIIRLDANGNYDNFISTANSQYREIWEMGFHCLSADVFILGGGTSSNLCAATVNTVNSSLNITTFHPLITSCCLDIVSHAIDDQGNIFTMFAGPSVINNKLTMVNSTFNGNVWVQSSGYTSFNENSNKGSFSPAATSNGFNCLAVSPSYLYYYDGVNLSAYSKSTGTQVASTTISGFSLKAQGGIAVDDCDNLYLGGIGHVEVYHFNGTSFSSLSQISLSSSTTTAHVFDIKLNKSTKTLFVSGSGIVGTYSASASFTCPTMLGTCLFSQAGITATTNAITCASLGSATVSANGGLGPYTYTWIPSNQTGSVGSNLAPGTHTIIVYDAGYNQTFTTMTVFMSPVPLTGSVIASNVRCYGANNGSASIGSMNGGSSSQTYLWTSPSATQTAATATGLGIGTHTVTVTDALTYCSFTQTFAITQPPPLTLNIAAASSSACSGTPVNLTPLTGGGMPSYTYSWTNGPNTGTYGATGPPGTSVFTVTAFDMNSCAISKTISLNFVSTPTLTVSNASICPNQSATLTVSGANTYTWSSASSGTSMVASPTVTTVYTVTGASTICATTTTAEIAVFPVPQPTVANTGPVCNGQNLVLLASGGVTYTWTGPSSFNSTASQPTLSQATPVQSGVYQLTVSSAQGCTATATQSVTINPTPPVSATGSSVCATQAVSLTAVSTCSNCNYQWSGPLGFISSSVNPIINAPSPSSSGNYSVVITSPFGCINSAAANVTVSAMPSATIVSNSPRCAGSALSFSSSTSAQGLGYVWSGPNAFSSFAPNPSIANVTPAATGAYFLTVINGPCQFSVVAPAVVNPLPTVQVSANNTACETKSISLSATASSLVASSNWSGPAGYTHQGLSFIRLNATAGYSGVYTISVTDVNNCANTATALVTVMPNPTISAADVTVCLGDPATLSANGADSYYWIGPGLTSSSGETVSVGKATNVSPAGYFITGTAANGCTATAAMVLNTRPLPVPSMTLFPRDKICEGDTVRFRAAGGVKYEWRGPDQLYYEGITASIPFPSQSRAGQYSLTAVDPFGCRKSIDTLITVLATPYAGLNQLNHEACVPFCSDFLLQSSPSASLIARWHVGNSTYIGPSFRHCFTSSGTISVAADLTDPLTGCRNMQVFLVNAYPKPRADFRFDPESPVENEGPVIFISTSEGNQLTGFTWQFMHDKACNSKAPQTSCVFDTEGLYPVGLEVKNAWGCSDTIVKSIRIEPDFAVYVPNSFTPNEDDRNQVFVPVTRGASTIDFSVFDRWGQLMFHSNSFNSGWDGTFRGKSCPQDVYVWKVTVLSLKGDRRQMTGHVSLYR